MPAGANATLAQSTCAALTQINDHLCDSSFNQLPGMAAPRFTLPGSKP